MKKGKLTKTLSADYNNRHGRSVSDTDHKHVHFKKNPIKSTGLKGYSSFRDNRIPSRNMGSKNYMDSSSDSDSDIDLNEPIQTKSKLIPRMKMKIKPRQENVKFLNEDDEELLAQYVDKDYRGKTNKKHRKKTSSYDSDNSSEFSEDEYDVKKKNNNKHDFKKKKKISFMRQSSSSSSSNSSKSDYHKKHHRNKYSTDSDSDSSKKKKKLKKNKNIYKNKNINPSLQHSPKNNNFKTKFTNNSLSVIHTNDARNSSYLYGIINGDNSLLGINELERFFPDHVMRVFVGTWNMAQTTELPLTFNHFIMPMKVDHLSDIYVINVQEAVINIINFALTIQQMLGSEYVLYNNYCIGMLYQLIFIRRELIWYCSEAEMDFKSVRFGPKEYKTKGGQATCFQLFGTTFLFVNSHLTPHVKNNEKRLQDYNVISSSLNLPNKIKNRSPYNLGNHNVTSKFDHTIWAGDLNFRMDKDVHELHTKTIIRKDQLLKAIKKKKIFHKFIEGEITFKPTYKYKINTKDFCEDRAPAFTDRILIRSMEKKNSEIILYKSVSSVNSSDHQPVFAIYDIKIYPGRDEVPMNGGKFEHNVWIEAMKRRASGYNEPSRKAVSENHNKVIYSQACSIQ